MLLSAVLSWIWCLSGKIGLTSLCWYMEQKLGLSAPSVNEIREDVIEIDEQGHCSLIYRAVWLPLLIQMSVDILMLRSTRWSPPCSNLAKSCSQWPSCPDPSKQWAVELRAQNAWVRSQSHRLCTALSPFAGHPAETCIRWEPERRLSPMTPHSSPVMSLSLVWTMMEYELNLWEAF